MSTNIGQMDRTLRVSVGAGLVLAVAILVDGSLRWLLGIGMVLLVSGISGICPLYSLSAHFRRPHRYLPSGRVGRVDFPSLDADKGEIRPHD